MNTSRELDLNNALRDRENDLSGKSQGGNDTDPILTRLKFLEESVRQKEQELQEKDNQLQQKDGAINEHKELINLLNQGKVKDMESKHGEIEEWLTSLNLSPEKLEQFKAGIKALINQANDRNVMWEVAACASEAHKASVLKYEELITKANEYQNQIRELKGFKTAVSHIGEEMDSAMLDFKNGRKRSLESGPPPPARSGAEPDAKALKAAAINGAPEQTQEDDGQYYKRDAWNDFENLIKRQVGANYF